MAEERMPHVGDVVKWHDSRGQCYNALVTAVWGPKCINLVFVSGDESKQDSCGRQMERQTSATHKSYNNVHGFYWRFDDEEPNGYTPPVER